jgi:uncharacterized protein (TIGR03067 family)
MTCISIVVAAVGLLLGADAAERFDGKKDVESGTPRDSAFLLVAWQGQKDAAPDRSETEKKELEKVTGTWVQAGDNVPPENAKARLVYSGREFVGRLGEIVLFRGRVKLDPMQNPKAIDLTIDSGPNKDLVSLGVYELDGDSYRGCLAAPGKPRPTRLSPEPGSGQQRFAFRRVKDEGPDSPKLASPGPDPAGIQAELKRFEGTWSYAFVVREGTTVPEEDLKASRLVLQSDRFTVTEPKGTHRGKYAVNPTATPSTIDVTFTEGPNAGKTIRGIYEWKGDTCKVCMGMEGQPRPTAFGSQPGSGLVLEVLKREKP